MKISVGNFKLQSALRALRRDTRGQIAIMFAISAVMLISGVGAGIDLMRAYGTQQKLTEVAALTCQYSKAQSVAALGVSSSFDPNANATYVANVTNYLVSAWTTQQQIQYGLTTPTPFTSVQDGAANVTVSASVPTTFMKVFGYSAVPVAASLHCYDTPQLNGGTSQIVNLPTVVKEGFESAPCGQGTACYIAASGSSSSGWPAAATASSSFPSAPSYTGSAGTKWYVTGYCLETDGVGLINATDPEGTQSAELDCDNGKGTAGNSAITTSIYLENGNYELRWFYRARVGYAAYDPTYICGSTAADNSWANNTTVGAAWAPYIGASALRTNQINAYLDRKTAKTPPLHTTLDGTQQLAGSNMIDSCVYATNWVERSVRIKVTTASFYWLTFAADGANDSFGGQIDNIRLCEGTCTTTLQDNFPSSWLAANNGGVNKVLFEDTFESPLYTDNTGVSANTNGNLNLSIGTSGTVNSGWPNLASSGWATAPQNQLIYNTAYAAQGLQNLWVSTQNSGRNRLIGRPFLLVPGFYNLSYQYVSEATFPSLSATYCGATPGAANMTALSGSGTGTGRNTTQQVTGTLNTNTIAAFIASAQLASWPVGGGALNSTTSYTNPDGSVSTTPTVAPDTISLSNYSASATSALLDICGYSAGWTARSSNFEITKTGYYWLDFSTQMAGSSNYGGGAIDDVKLTALGSPAMASPPFNPVVVPAAGTQPGATLSFDGFFIIADPLVAPAALQ